LVRVRKIAAERISKATAAEGNGSNQLIINVVPKRGGHHRANAIRLNNHKHSDNRGKMFLIRIGPAEQVTTLVQHGRHSTEGESRVSDLNLRSRHLNLKPA